MTDREKLVRLIDESAYIKMAFPEGQISYYLDSEKIADHLLAHGVTVKEPQKPLTVGETIAAINRVGDKLYIEDKEYPHNTGYDEFGVVRLWTSNPKNREEYGKKWRCWAENPTEEERKAAEWD